MRKRVGPTYPVFPLVWLGLGLVSGCTILPSGRGGYEYTVPVEAGDGWRTASLFDQGMNPDPIVGLMNRLRRHEDHLIHSLLIVKDGALVFEEYFDGRDVDFFGEDLLLGDTLNLVERHFTRDDLHHCASVTKSVTSQVFGIAMDRGHISGTDATMFSFFPDYAYLRSPEKDQISVRDMLSMTSGLPFDENTYPIADDRNDAFQLYFSEDPIAFVLSQDVAYPPGTTYQYNSGTTVLLGEIIRRAAGESLTSYAEEHLFSPLGIHSYEWARMPEAPGVSYGAGGLYLRPRDMAKIGQLMLQDGAWAGRPVLSSEWVRRSVTEEIMVLDGGDAEGYGFQWKLGRFGGTDAYWAAGWGGQYIVVFPDQDLVFVQTGGRYSRENVPVRYNDIIENHILPAVDAGSR
jgi:CubicO group peptidase (beta-lactamase class C family)